MEIVKERRLVCYVLSVGKRLQRGKICHSTQRHLKEFGCRLESETSAAPVQIDNSTCLSNLAIVKIKHGRRVKLVLERFSDPTISPESLFMDLEQLLDKIIKTLVKF